jgi:hypothetical protein
MRMIFIATVILLHACSEPMSEFDAIVVCANEVRPLYERNTRSSNDAADRRYEKCMTKLTKKKSDRYEQSTNRDLRLASSSVSSFSGYRPEIRRDANPMVIRSLAKNNVRGCGNFYYQEHSEGGNVFLVTCIDSYNMPQDSLVVFGNIEAVNRLR